MVYTIPAEAGQGKDREFAMTEFYPTNQSEKPVSDLLVADVSLNTGAASLDAIVHADRESVDRTFFAPHDRGYVLDAAMAHDWPLRMVTHPRATRTCYEKAALLGDWSPLNTIKALYFEHAPTGRMFSVVVPETGCFLDRAAVAAALGVADSASLSKACRLPRGMSPGTCSPFLHRADAASNGGPVAGILFDRQSLAFKVREKQFDDFSFGDQTEWSLQIHYAHAFALLREAFGELVREADLLPLAFRERLVRRQGTVRIEYQFQSIDYRTAQFMESVHGRGDLEVENDMVDELFVQEIQTLSRQDWII